MADGMQIDASDGQEENAEPPRRDSFEPNPNRTVDSFAHSVKQFSPMTSTEDGMQIDESDEQRQNPFH
jgi:hypothetical protein